MTNDLTTISIRDQGGGAPNLFTPILWFFTVAELVELCPPFWTGTPGVAAMPRTLEVESRGRTCPDRRDLGATEEQDEGSTGRSPNLHFYRE